MTRVLTLCLCLVACRHPRATYLPLEAPCSADRVGRVVVAGGSREDVPQLAVLEGTLDNPARTERIAAVSTELLRARGYARAEVRVERRQGCGVELYVTVDRGPKFRIGSIRFLTDDPFPPAARLAAIEDALGTINAVGGAYVPERLARGLGELAKRYYEAGWLEAAIDPPQATYDEARGEIALAIAVHAGRRFKIGRIAARGGRRTTRAAVIEALGLAGGQWYDAARVRAGLARARREVDERVEISMQIDADRIDLEAVVGDPQ